MQISTKYHLTVQGIGCCQATGILFSSLYLICSSLVGGGIEDSVSSMPTETFPSIFYIGTYDSLLGNPTWISAFPWFYINATEYNILEYRYSSDYISHRESGKELVLGNQF